jgi:hypothetical protein
LLTGCGGSVRAPDNPQPPAHAVTADIASRCLNADLFLVNLTGPATVAGSSPQGVNFRIRFYRSPAAANAAHRRLRPRYSAIFVTAVVDFAGNPPARRGGRPRVLEHIDLATIRHCIERPGVVPAYGG